MTPDRIYVTDIVLEPPRPREPLTFDPEIDLGQEYWPGLIDITRTEYLRLVRARYNLAPPQKQDRINFIRTAFAVFILSPQRFLELGIKEGECESIRSVIDEGPSVNYPHAFAYNHFFAPAKFKLTNNRREENPFLNNVRGAGSRKDWTGYLSLILIGKCLLPDAGFTPDPTTIQPILAHIEELKSEHDLGLTQLWRLMALLKILCPGNMPKFDQDDWRTARNAFELIRETSLTEFIVRIAADLKILAAKEAKVNEQGLVEITMPETTQPFTTPTPPMPKRRNF